MGSLCGLWDLLDIAYTAALSGSYL